MAKSPSPQTPTRKRAKAEIKVSDTLCWTFFDFSPSRVKAKISMQSIVEPSFRAKQQMHFLVDPYWANRLPRGVPPQKLIT
eukprot:1387014-Amphidinium_carterae.1